MILVHTVLRMLKVSYRQQCGLSVAKKKFQCSGVACGLPREVDAWANSVYQTVFSPLPTQVLGYEAMSHTEVYVLHS